MEKPNYVFEVSWEVCNMVGGIHTVLQSKASQMRREFGENHICVGPHVPQPISSNPAFREEIWDEAIYKLIQDFGAQGVTCQMGRWQIPGDPKVLLVDFRDLFENKDRILAHYWERFGVSSLFGGYDYFEPILFAHATGLLIEQIYNRLLFPAGKKVLVHSHEWMASIALLHLKEAAPEIGTVFTTHATMLGRSLSSRGEFRPLDAFISEQPAIEWARQVGVDSKHSVETVVARESDCFTTVSETTGEECAHILGKKPDCVVHNGLSEDTPSRELLEPALRKRMRARLLEIASEVTGFKYDPARTSLLATSGRYEFRNKGVDLYLDAVLDLRDSLKGAPVKEKVIAFVMCPAGHMQRVFPRSPEAFSTHQLVEPQHDPVLRALQARGQVNSAENPVHVVFLPLYLNGSDPTLPESYWELLSAIDVAVFPSWYEPWGYTPHEAVSLGIPTITTDCAGFGRWAQDLPGTAREKGVVVIDRARLKDQGVSYAQPRAALQKQLLEMLKASPEERRSWSEGALRTAKKARWDDLIAGYSKAYSFAMERAGQRLAMNPQSRFRTFSLGNVMAPSPFSSARANVRNFSVTTRFPTVLQSLRDIMDSTITWKWNPKLVQLLCKLDPELWARVDHSPGRFIRNVDEKAIKMLTTHPELKKILEELRSDLEARSARVTDFERAYFCMEYGITDELRIYSGGLGILAGDHLKTASDMRMPLAAFGLFYQYGYFRQGFGPAGQQLAHYQRSELENLKLSLVQDESGGRMLLSVPFEEETLYFQAWTLDLNGVNLYLLDSNVMENPARLRGITDRLYNSEGGKRVRQEWLLSQGGLELIRKLGLGIKVFHMNEGHTAFLAVGRTLELMAERGLSFDEAFDYARMTTVFTTHTPVPAGHDEFPLEEVVRLLRGRIQDQAILDRVLALGTSLKGAGGDSRFSMTALAMRGARWVNAVSRIHQTVSQKMFNNLYPELEDHEVPVTHVTNGVHVPSWLSSSWQSLFFETLGNDWPKRTCDPGFWKQLENIPLERFWEVKLRLKQRLIDWIRKRLDQDLQRGANRPEYAKVLAKLDTNTLIITHAKRMAPYKRADLLFQDPDRLHEFLKNSSVPILFVYAGKAHPADGLGQEALQRLIQWGRDPRFMGSVLVLEDYDLSFSRRLMAGSDIWLNTPLRPLEASGTSGMKAAINGTPHFSVADGWWPEAYNGKNGWMLGDGSETWEKHLQDRYDCDRIFHILQNEILREFLPPSPQEMPRAWVNRIRESIVSVLPFVSSERMLQDYETRLYGPALRAAQDLEKNQFEKLRKLSRFKQTINEYWNQLDFEEVNLGELSSGRVPRSHATELQIELTHPGLKPEHVRMQAILSRREGVFQAPERNILPLECLSFDGEGRSQWRLLLDHRKPGEYSLSFRATAQQFGDYENAGLELKLVKWM